jgi:hypothetical protein
MFQMLSHVSIPIPLKKAVCREHEETDMSARLTIVAGKHS